jgi:rhodanese-related sulfurtransferase
MLDVCAAGKDPPFDALIYLNVEPRPPMYQSLDPVRLQTLLQGAEPPRLIDVRSAAEIARGAIAGATHIELSTLPARSAELDPQAPCVLYCLSGARSAQGCAYLAQRGFQQLYHLDGGIAAWAKAGLPVTL